MTQYQKCTWPGCVCTFRYNTKWPSFPNNMSYCTNVTTMALHIEAWNSSSPNISQNFSNVWVRMTPVLCCTTTHRITQISVEMDSFFILRFWRSPSITLFSPRCMWQCSSCSLSWWICSLLLSSKLLISSWRLLANTYTQTNNSNTKYSVYSAGASFQWATVKMPN